MDDEEEEKEEVDAVIFAQEMDSNIHLAVTREQFRLVRFRPAVAMVERGPGVAITLDDLNQVGVGPGLVAEPGQHRSKDVVPIEDGVLWPHTGGDMGCVGSGCT